MNDIRVSRVMTSKVSQVRARSHERAYAAAAPCQHKFWLLLLSLLLLLLLWLLLVSLLDVFFFNRAGYTGQDGAPALLILRPIPCFIRPIPSSIDLTVDEYDNE